MKQGCFIRVPREGFTTSPERGLDIPLAKRSRQISGLDGVYSIILFSDGLCQTDTRRSPANAPASPGAPTFGALPPASLQSCASLRPRHTVHPLELLCVFERPHAAPAHPCARGIPFILWNYCAYLKGLTPLLRIPAPAAYRSSFGIVVRI